MRCLSTRTRILYTQKRQGLVSSKRWHKRLEEWAVTEHIYVYWWQSLRAEIARRVSIRIQQIYSINSTATIGNGTKPRDELMKLLQLQQQQQKQQQQQRQSLRHTILLSYTVCCTVYTYIFAEYFIESHILCTTILFVFNLVARFVHCAGLFILYARKFMSRCRYLQICWFVLYINIFFYYDYCYYYYSFSRIKSIRRVWRVLLG